MGFVMILYYCRYFLKPKGGVSHTPYGLPLPSLLGYGLTKKPPQTLSIEAISSREFSHCTLEFVTERSKEKSIVKTWPVLLIFLLIVFRSLGVAS